MIEDRQRDEDLLDGSPPTVESEASGTFVRRLYGEWTGDDQAALGARLAADPRYADAYRRIEATWSALDAHAEAPEVLAYREEAIALARRANARRWSRSSPRIRARWRVAAIAGAAVLTAISWQLSPYGYRPGVYRTDIGQQRTVELADRSRIALDAATLMQVRFSDEARVVQLKEGQAQFTVAHDPMRPFKVQVGDWTIVALGTVFTVDYTNRKVHVAMMEGRVAVIAANPAPRGAAGASSSAIDGSSVPGRNGTIELSAGQELDVSRDGRTTLIQKADIEAATAWREGKVIFRTEPLSEAVRRLNRYSSLQIEIETESLADERISGVFEAGDTRGFVRAIERYLPVTADYSDDGIVRLSAK